MWRLSMDLNTGTHYCLCLGIGLICCGRDVSPDDTGKTVYVRSIRNRLETKIFIYSRYDVIYTVCLWQMLIGA